MKRQAGFTLIELVIVIVILGILAATALPRFVDLSTDARVAALNGLAGGIRSAASIARATQLAKGYSLGNAVVLDGQAVAMSAGYPTAAAVSQAITDTSGFVIAYTSPNSSVEFRLGNRTDCIVSYNEATSTSPFIVSIRSTGTNGC